MDIQAIIDAIRYNRVRITDHADEEAQADRLSFDEIFYHLPPHFHAEYQDFEATIEIASGLVTGRMPRRALNLIWSWLDEHRDEVMENWKRAQARQALKPVEPLR
ncbi:DUF4160 domain-containing protein [Candidatus Chloroploca sp. Khr17]|uniref:DUF4160 domain-containing protein n=1 Tax=Candidatus Chloroploca sp. Khr17 TaxID=2496869 RepID=UPI00101D12D1|nr:DUF4160 domain-containing protein [Candidatus Chloroploca sp. Khr17]